MNVVNKFLKYSSGFIRSKRKKELIKCLHKNIIEYGFIDGIKNFLHKRTNTVYYSLYLDIPKIDIDDRLLNKYYDCKENESINALIKVIAFYLPQFHPFKENDEFWGKGFTEWTNVTKAHPNFVGHYQPHLPIHLGFYDLRILDNIREQAKLAKNYGVNGFCFYYYWFSGKKVMDTPIRLLLENKDIDLEFFICWANENWTRRWDGLENDILLQQYHHKDDPVNFIKDVIALFYDSRYIKINGKPMLMVYNPTQIPNFSDVIACWRSEVKNYGIDDLYIICAKTFGFKNSEGFNIDCLVDFPPHCLNANTINHTLKISNNNFKGNIYQYEEALNHEIKKNIKEKKFESAMLGWDNTARKQNNSHTFIGCDPLKFSFWLSNICLKVINNKLLASNEKFVFINAWNEWAEGTHLEPDRQYGFAYLNAAYQTLRSFDTANKDYFDLYGFTKKNDYLIIFHLHYLSCMETLSKILCTTGALSICDLIITMTTDVATNNNILKVLDLFPAAKIVIVENRGRDILPFIKVFKEIYTLNYKFICKLHSKKSKYRNDGEDIYNSLLSTLINDNVFNILKMGSFERDDGVILSSNSALKLNSIVNGVDVNYWSGNKLVDLCKLLRVKLDYNEYFPAGSMYWFRPSALKGLEMIDDSMFDLECGYVDGTTQHAVERVICLLCKENGYNIKII